jgi:hypothetical protein
MLISFIDRRRRPPPRVTIDGMSVPPGRSEGADSPLGGQRTK